MSTAVFFPFLLFLTWTSDSSAELCDAFDCPEHAFNRTVLRFSTKNGKEDCSSCDQCTENGYNICLRGEKYLSDLCGCAHSIPADCSRWESRKGKLAPLNTHIFSACYRTSLKMPPKPAVVSENATEDQKALVIVTIYPFWQEVYWSEMQPSKLFLHFDYLLDELKDCEGDIKTSKELTGNNQFLCANMLEIDLSMMAIEDNDNGDEYDDSAPPEVQFDREVFASAKQVKFFTTITVHRPRQLHYKEALRDLTTEVESESILFDLEPLGKENEKAEVEMEEDELGGAEKTLNGCDFFSDCDEPLQSTPAPQMTWFGGILVSYGPAPVAITVAVILCILIILGIAIAKRDVICTSRSKKSERKTFGDYPYTAAKL